MIRGTLVEHLPAARSGTMRPCSRCGVMAERRPTTVLCQDCIDGMSPAEVRMWRAAA
ncbi:hypothetical protein SEA_GINGERBUG_53 [Microbacterium phage Gingerbug]|nr:hypothetical protein SEA_GINGERBUG_53 [Microbacterium phage Gingerbug]